MDYNEVVENLMDLEQKYNDLKNDYECLEEENTALKNEIKEQKRTLFYIGSVIEELEELEDIQLDEDEDDDEAQGD